MRGIVVPGLTGIMSVQVNLEHFIRGNLCGMFTRKNSLMTLKAAKGHYKF